MWEEVSGLLDHEQAIWDAFDGHATRFRRSASRKNHARLMEIVGKLEQERRAYLRLAAQGQVGDEELTGILTEIEAKKHRTEQELVAARDDATLAGDQNPSGHAHRRRQTRLLADWTHARGAPRTLTSGSC